MPAISWALPSLSTQDLKVGLTKTSASSVIYHLSKHTDIAMGDVLITAGSADVLRLFRGRVCFDQLQVGEFTVRSVPRVEERVASDSSLASENSSTFTSPSLSFSSSSTASEPPTHFSFISYVPCMPKWLPPIYVKRLSFSYAFSSGLKISLTGRLATRKYRAEVVGRVKIYNGTDPDPLIDAAGKLVYEQCKASLEAELISAKMAGDLERFLRGASARCNFMRTGQGRNDSALDASCEIDALSMSRFLTVDTELEVTGRAMLQVAALQETSYAVGVLLESQDVGGPMAGMLSYNVCGIQGAGNGSMSSMSLSYSPSSVSTAEGFWCTGISKVLEHGTRLGCSCTDAQPLQYVVRGSRVTGNSGLLNFEAVHGGGDKPDSVFFQLKRGQTVFSCELFNDSLALCYLDNPVGGLSVNVENGDEGLKALVGLRGQLSTALLDTPVILPWRLDTRLWQFSVLKDSNSTGFRSHFDQLEVSSIAADAPGQVIRLEDLAVAATIGTPVTGTVKTAFLGTQGTIKNGNFVVTDIGQNSRGGLRTTIGLEGDAEVLGYSQKVSLEFRSE